MMSGANAETFCSADVGNAGSEESAALAETEKDMLLVRSPSMDCGLE